MTACAPEKKRASWGRKLLILLAVALLLLWFMQQNLNQVVLSMAIIVGLVPDSFVDVNNDSEMLNLIP